MIGEFRRARVEQWVWQYQQRVAARSGRAIDRRSAARRSCASAAPLSLPVRAASGSCPRTARHAGEVAGGSRNASGQARCEAPLNFRGIPMTQPPGDFMKTRGRGQSDRRPVHPVVIPRSKCEAAQSEIKSPAEAGQKGRRVGRPAAGPTLCLRAGPALAARRSKSARRERRQPSGLLREPLSA